MWKYNGFSRNYVQFTNITNIEYDSDNTNNTYDHPNCFLKKNIRQTLIESNT